MLSPEENGFDFDKVRRDVGYEPVNPVWTILIYAGISFIFSVICVLAYYLMLYDGDWSRVMADDEGDEEDGFFRKSMSLGNSFNR